MSGPPLPTLEFLIRVDLERSLKCGISNQFKGNGKAPGLRANTLRVIELYQEVLYLGQETASPSQSGTSSKSLPFLLSDCSAQAHSRCSQQELSELNVNANQAGSSSGTLFQWLALGSGCHGDSWSRSQEIR